MELKDILQPDNIRLRVHVRNKKALLENMCEVLRENGFISDAKIFLRDVLEREKLGPTAIGQGVAIPHGKSPQVTTPTIVIFRLATPIPWESIDVSEAVDTVILFCVSATAAGAEEHLRLLAQTARKLAHDDAITALKDAETPEEIISALV